MQDMKVDNSKETPLRRRSPLHNLKLSIKSLKNNISSDSQKNGIDARKVYYNSSRITDPDIEDDSETSGYLEPPSTFTRSMTPLGLISIATESDTNLNIAACGIQLVGELSYDEIISLIDEKICMKHYRFRCVVENRKFVQNGSFDVKNHVKFLKIPPSGKEDKHLRRSISTFLNVPLPKNQPLWECLVIEGHSKGQFLFFRIHHSIGDGTSLSSCFLGMCDQSLEEIQNSIKEEIIKSKGRSRGRKRKRDKIFATVKKMFMVIVGTVIVMFKWTVELLKGKDDPSIFNRGEKLGVNKKTAYIVDYFKLDQVKEIGAKTDSTVNDVMLSVICSGMTAYIHKKASDDDIGVQALRKEMKRLRISIPVNIRKQFIATKLRNMFGFVILRVPIGGPNSPEERLKLVKAEMDACKKLPEPFCTFYIGRLLNILPIPVIGSTFKNAGRMLTFIFSNMRGSPTKLTVLGREIQDILGFVPCPSGASTGFALLSYQDKLSLTVVVDETTIKHPQELMDCIKEEYDRLYQETVGHELANTH